MKRQKPIREYFYNALPIIASTVLICCIALTSGIGRVGLACASVMMPNAGAAAVREWFGSQQASGEQTQLAPHSQAIQKSDTTQKINTLTVTPPDIAELIKKYAVEFADDVKAGVIKTVTYGKDNATHTFGNVTVRNTTKTKTLNIGKVLEQRADMEITDISQPTVLIFHTHTSEGYEMLERDWYAKGYSARSNNPGENIVRVGSEIAKCLTLAGFTVIHDKEIHDDTYGTAYDHSGNNVQEYLKQYPSIQVVLDIHRDAIHPSDERKIKPAAVIDGKTAAQVMIITGAQEGNVKEFPDWEYNLCFALHLQQKCETMYPGLMRPVLFSPRKYNMYMSHCNLLLEMGSDVNTLDEAVYSGRLVANALAELMKEYVK